MSKQRRHTPISTMLPSHAVRHRTPSQSNHAHIFRAVRWVSSRFWWEGAGVSILLVSALVLRAYHLITLPAGIHGDEAVFGTAGEAVRLHGSVGPYSYIAAGQPTGPFYLDAITVAMFGHTIFAVRVVSMLVGTLTIPLCYLVLRRSFNRMTGFVGAALLAVMNWHLHFSHVGFALSLWLFGVVLTTGALIEAIRHQNWRWWAATGIIAGLNIYVYNAHTVFLAILLLFITVSCIRALTIRVLSLRTCLRNIFAFAIPLGITVYPMVAFVLGDRQHYAAHLSFWSVFNHQEWQSLTTANVRVVFLVGRYVQYWDHISFHPQYDGADATSIISTIPPALLVLAVSGIVLALLRYRTPLVVFGLCVIVLMPLATVFTVDGVSRRTFASAVFVAMFAAFPFVEAIRLMGTWETKRGQAVGIVLAACVLLLTGYQSVHAYFVTFADSPRQAYVFTNEMTDASRFMATLSSDSYVYFYSERWSVKYETRQFLAPSVHAEDRSAEYGQLGFDVDPAKGHAVFVFLGTYQPLYEQVRDRYPRGTLLFGSAADRPTFVAYVLDTGS